MTEMRETHLAREAATAIVRRLRSEGYQAFFAGGCVRDLLLGRTPKDYDVATSAEPSVVLDMFSKTFSVGAHFGVVLVAEEYEGKEFVTEVATFRNDGVYSDGRHPDAVRFSQTAEEDVQRRDFTINGMLLDPLALEEGQELAEAVKDFVGGLADLRAGIVRAIGEPERRFQEDKLRLLRAIRFASRFGFELEAKTKSAMQAIAPQIVQVSRERVRDELTRMLTEGHARRAFEMLDETGLLAEVLPEIAKMKGVEQPPQFHPEGDVWTHTLLLLEGLSAGISPTLAWGALLHDVGKPATFRRAPDRIRFDGHVEVGVRIAEELLKSLRFSNEETAQILLLVENHMRFADVMHMKSSTLKRFFRLDRFEEHLELHRLDCLSSKGDLTLYNFAKQNYEQIPAATVKPPLLVTGKDLIAAGYKPGVAFKQMLLAVEDAQLEGQVHTREEGLQWLREHFGKESS